MRHVYLLPVLSSIFLSYANIFAQPSFSCSKAKKGAETLICASQEVSNLDAQVSKAYKSVPISDARKRDQAAWLEQRDAHCKTNNRKIADDKKIACLKFEYERRLALLTNSNASAADWFVSFRETDGVRLGRANLRFLSTFAYADERKCWQYLDIYKGEGLVPHQSMQQQSCEDGAGNLDFKDVNFDGRNDLLIFNADASGKSNNYYLVMLFNPKTEQFYTDETFPSGGFPEVDMQRKELRTHENGGHAGRIGSSSVYKFNNGRYSLVRFVRSTWLPDYCREKLACKPGDKRARCKEMESCNGGDPEKEPCSQYVSVTSFYGTDGKVVRESVGKNGDSSILSTASICG